MTSSVNNRMRKLLSERVAELGPTEHDEIFKIMRANDIKHSCNANGVFIAMSTIPEAVVQQISAMVDYHMTNNKHLEAREKSLHQYKITHHLDSLVVPEPLTQPPLTNPPVCTSSSSSSLSSIHTTSVSTPPPVPVPPTAAQIAASCAASTQPPRGKTVTTKFQQTKKRFARRRAGHPPLDVDDDL